MNVPRRNARNGFLAGAMALAVGSPAQAAPVEYHGLALEVQLEQRADRHSEREVLIEETITIDQAAGTIEFGSFVESGIDRSFDLQDASAVGAQVTAPTDSGADDCDGAPPCPEPIDITLNYLTIDDEELFRPKALIAPDGEMIFTVNGEVERINRKDEIQTEMQLLLAKPASLSVADLNGTYTLNVYNTEKVGSTDGSSEEYVGVFTLDITFDGNGSCSGGFTGSQQALQPTGWPDLSNRQNIIVDSESGAAVSACTYSVDAAAGAATLSLTIPDDEGDETVDITFKVSANYRYLAGTLIQNRQDSPERSQYGLIAFVGARRASGITYPALGGVYFASTFGKHFETSSAAGKDADLLTRLALELSGSLPDTSGFSGCTVLGEARFGSVRTLGGIVPDAEPAAVEATTSLGDLYGDCRYRIVGGDMVDLQLSADGGTSWDAVQFMVADGGQTLIAVSLYTSEDPLPLDTDVTLATPGFARAGLTVMQLFDGTATDPIVADFIQPILPPVDANVVLAASVLPASRSVQVGTTATAFATIINAGSVEGLRCGIQLRDDLPVDFFYQTTDPLTNVPVGDPDEPVDITAGAAQTFFFGITPQAEIPATDVPLDFTCLNGNDAARTVGVNSILLSAESVAGPDVIALAATVTNDGIVHLSGEPRSGFFALASVNVGAGDVLIVGADTGAAALPIAGLICQTDPVSGACINPTTASSDPVTLTVNPNETPTFSLFVTASEDIPLDAATKRIFVRFRDVGGAVRGATSVAVQTD